MIVQVCTRVRCRVVSLHVLCPVATSVERRGPQNSATAQSYNHDRLSTLWWRSSLNTRPVKNRIFGYQFCPRFAATQGPSVYLVDFGLRDAGGHTFLNPSLLRAKGAQAGRYKAICGRSFQVAMLERSWFKHEGSAVHWKACHAQQGVHAVTQSRCVEHQAFARDMNRQGGLVQRLVCGTVLTRKDEI